MKNGHSTGNIDNLLRLGREDLAWKVLSTSDASEIHPRHLPYLLWLGYKINGLEGLKKQFQKLESSELLTSDLIYFYIKILAARGEAKSRDLQGRSCIDLLEESLAKDPTHINSRIAYAYLLTQRNDEGDKEAGIQIADEILSENSCSDIAVDNLRLLSNIFRLNGDHLRAQSISKETTSRLLVSSQTKRFLEHLDTLKTLPGVLASESEVEETIESARNALLQLLDSPVPQKSEREELLSSLLLINNFYLPYLTNNDVNLSSMYSRLLRKNLNNLISTRDPTEEAGARKMLVLSSFRQHPKIFVFNFLKEILADPTWQVHMVNFADGPFPVDIANSKYAGNVRFIDMPLNQQTYDRFLHLLKSERYSTTFFPEIGITPESRFLSNHRFSPHQFTSWLHPCSSGSPDIDFFLSGELMEGQNSQEHYSEKLVCLTGVGQYFDTSVREAGEFLDVLPGRVVCLQSPFKLRPLFDGWLEEILTLDSLKEFYFLNPTAVMHKKIIEGRFSRLRNAEKIKFLDRMNGEVYSNFLATVDIAIDSPTWSGGNTTIDCMLRGVPVVGHRGGRMRASHTYGIYRCLGLSDELVVSEKSEFKITVNRLLIDRRFNLRTRQALIGGADQLEADGISTVKELKTFLDNLEYNKI